MKNIKSRQRFVPLFVPIVFYMFYIFLAFDECVFAS